ncbi:MAG: hypothetical protein AMQ74_00544 [Candidatus Methanofastidiosum methylothiophilum]|uniref:Uncharacterized protein n=1 Tax=Candidatus Methanofastidiosum methylothiophilum TaxID=1705564 RepID=A0A150J6T9_9EURY|nr:MAG: hypothetical protein AMQ74_00544 [Candidatus Methanofastidiosum methylthiophilus]
MGNPRRGMGSGIIGPEQRPVSNTQYFDGYIPQDNNITNTILSELGKSKFLYAEESNISLKSIERQMNLILWSYT